MVPDLLGRVRADVLGDRLAGLSELSGDDLATLQHMIDALVAKNRLKTLASGIG
jgi:hypothetical protein